MSIKHPKLAAAAVSLLAVGAASAAVITSASAADGADGADAGVARSAPAAAGADVGQPAAIEISRDADGGLQIRAAQPGTVVDGEAAPTHAG